MEIATKIVIEIESVLIYLSNVLFIGVPFIYLLYIKMTKSERKSGK